MFCRKICLVKLTVIDEIYCTILNMLIYKNLYSCVPKGRQLENRRQQSITKT